jgi:uncharacterized protein (UPF0297 family)
METDKIFCRDVREYLIELGMEAEQIEAIRKKKIKEYAISVLNKVIEAIESEDYNSIEQYTRFSPSGDCMGDENTYIDFGGIANITLDIEELFKYYLTYENND